MMGKSERDVLDVVRFVQPLCRLTHKVVHLLHRAGRGDVRVKALHSLSQDQTRSPMRNRTLTVIANSVTHMGIPNAVQYDSTCSLKESKVVV